MIGPYDRDRIQPLFSWKEIEMGNRREKFGVTLVMKKGTFVLLLCFSLLLLLNGCLDFERASVSIDLANRVAEVTFVNIVSNSRDEETIKEDFRDLIKRVYFDEDSKSNPDRITSRRLYKSNERLDGIERFSFKSLQKVLKEFSIEVDKKGDYILDLTKESEHFRISGNGQTIERDSKKFLRWPRYVKKIEFEEVSKEFDETKKTGLLKYWVDWVDRNMKE
jgi:hypothetical protein